MAIKLKDDVRKKLIATIQSYCEENMNESIGDLKAGFLLEFMLKEIGPAVYNKAIADAQAYFQERVTDLDGCCYEPEVGQRITRRKTDD